MRKNGVLCSLVLLSCFIASNVSCKFVPCKLANTWHFNTTVLNNPQLIRQNLKEDAPREGYEYQEVDFHPVNDQNKTLKGIFLERPNARATIIFTPGFWPGLKEKFATFVKIMPKDCNLFFIELINHGQSDDYSCCSSVATCCTPSCCLNNPALQMPSCFNISGLNCMKCSFCKLIKFALNLKKYGTEEHLSIIGALDYTAEKTNRKPIVLFGWCAGAFHSARTLLKLKEFSQKADQNLIEAYNIQGLIFESGFGSLTDMIKGLYLFMNKKVIPGCMGGGQSSGFLGKIKSALRFLGTGLSNLLLKGLEFWVRPALEKNHAETNLYDKIHLLEDLPIFVSHSEGDELSGWRKTKQLVDRMQNKELWLTPGSSHATKHLKHKDEYKQKMKDWLDKIIHYTPSDDNTNEIRQQMIRIIDQMIKIVKQVLETAKKPDGNAEQKIENLGKKFEELLKKFKEFLNNPDSDLSEETKDKIKKELKKIIRGTPPVEIIEILDEIKKLLQNPNYEPKSRIKKSTGRPLPQKNKLEESPANNKLNPWENFLPPRGNKDRNNKEEKPRATRYAPTSKNNSKSSSPSRSRSRRTPSSSGSSYPRNYGSNYPYNDNGDYNNTAGGYPAYNGTDGSGMSGRSWPRENTNQKNNKSQETPVTSRDMLYLDERYGPEMEDQPDSVVRRRRYPRQNYNNLLAF